MENGFFAGDQCCFLAQIFHGFFAGNLAATFFFFDFMWNCAWESESKKLKCGGEQEHVLFLRSAEKTIFCKFQQIRP